MARGAPRLWVQVIYAQRDVRRTRPYRMTNKRNSRDIGIVEEPRGSGRYYIRVYHNGKRYKRCAASKAHARELREEIRVAIRRGEWPPTPRAKEALFDDLLQAYRAEKTREGRAVMDGDIGFRRLLERFGGRRAKSLATREVKEWRDELRKGHTPATVNRHLTLLRAILRMGIRDRKSKQVPCPNSNLWRKTMREYAT